MTRIHLTALALIASLSGCDSATTGYRQAMLHLHHNRFEDARRLLLPLAANDNAPAQYQLALLRRQQAGQWDDAALAELNQAARAGHLGARYQLALARREDGAPEKAEHGFKALAREGFVPAQFDLAQLLELRADPGALEWFERAGEAGHEGAVKRLAQAYERGELGLTKDVRLATAWRERLAVKKF